MNSNPDRPNFVPADLRPADSQDYLRPEFADRRWFLPEEVQQVTDEDYMPLPGDDDDEDDEPGEGPYSRRFLALLVAGSVVGHIALIFYIAWASDMLWWQTL